MPVLAQLAVLWAFLNVCYTHEDAFHAVVSTLHTSSDTATDLLALPLMLAVPMQVICKLLTQSLSSSQEAQQGQQAPPSVQDAKAPLVRQAAQWQGPAQVQAARVPKAVPCSSCCACEASAKRHTLALHLTHTGAGGALYERPQPHSFCWPLEPCLASCANQAAHPRGGPRMCMTEHGQSSLPGRAAWP